MQQFTKTSSAPHPVDYLDARKFLRDYMEYRKATEQSFSYAKWARELGFSSRSFLRLILVGKRNFTESSIYRIADGLKLKARDHEYFTQLVKFNQAKDAKERERLASALARMSPSTAHAKILDHYKFLSSHHCPRILSLLSIEGFRKTSEHIASVLGIRETDVLKLLNNLENLGLAAKEKENGSIWWKATALTFSVEGSSSISDTAIQTYHRKSLLDAIQSLELPANQRDFKSILVTLNEDSFEQLRCEMEAHLFGLLAKYQNQEGPNPKRLYQINANIIPVSNAIHSELPSRTDSRTTYSTETQKESQNEIFG